MPESIKPTVAVPNGRSRNVINEIIAGKLYQRGQILTWQRKKKYGVLHDYGIKTVVNFWPKIDSDLGEAEINYLHLPAAQSEQMLEPRMTMAAQWVAQLCEIGPVLVLCEAGMTRSVYFCVLVVSLLLGISLEKAREHVVGHLSRVSLKPLMLRRIARGWDKKKSPSKCCVTGAQQEPAEATSSRSWSGKPNPSS